MGRGVRRARARRRHAGGADARRAAVHPGAGPRARRPASGWCSPAGATRASTSGCSTTRPPGPRSSRCRWATTCSTAARWPRWRSTEAVVRLLPGFLGNAESLAEESHEDGLLEYPVYTRPAVLARPRRARRCCSPATTRRSSAWRADQARRRTAERRPDLLHPSVGPAGEWELGARRARRRRRDPDPAAGVLGPGGARQRHARTSRRCTSPWPTSRRGWRLGRRAWCASRAGSSARCAAGSRPPAQRPGTSAGSWSLPTSRAAGSGGCCSSTSRPSRRPRRRRTSLFTGARSDDNLRMYQKAGYQPAPRPRRPRPGAVVLTKPDSARLSRPVADSSLGPVGRRTARTTCPGSLRRAPATGGASRRRPPDWADT